MERGTRVTLYLKGEAKELTDDKKLAQLIKQYSEFIQFPIRLWQSKAKTEQVRALELDSSLLNGSPEWS